MTIFDHAHSLAAGPLRARFLPACGMVCASLTHEGEELLRGVDDLEAAARQGRTAGIPLLYPWANRLAVPRYEAAGKQVELDADSPLLRKGRFGLLNHGIPWPHLQWKVLRHDAERIAARLEWDRAEWLGVFPFRHRVEMNVALSAQSLAIAAAVFADEPMPVSFGFHPYLGIPGLARSEWQLELPAMRQLVLDRQKIPTGEERAFAAFHGPLADLDLDAGFALPPGPAFFGLHGNGRRIVVEFAENYPYLQLFAPREKELIAIEPMTAPANALVSGKGLRMLAPGESFRALFRIGVQSA